MCEAVREWKESLMQEGKVQGIELGKSYEKQSTYKMMLSKGFTIEQIADIFSVRIESIQELIK